MKGICFLDLRMVFLLFCCRIVCLYLIPMVFVFLVDRKGLDGERDLKAGFVILMKKGFLFL